MRSNFGKDMIFKTVAEVITAVLGVITFSILSQSLSKDEYAIVNQFISIGVLVAPIILVKMNNAFCIFLSNESDKSILKSRFFSTSILTLIISIIIISIVYAFKDSLTILMFNDIKFSFVVPYMIIYYTLLSFSTLAQDFYRAMTKIKKASIIIILKSIFLAFSFIYMYNNSSVVNIKNSLIVYCSIELIILVFCYLNIFKMFKGYKFMFDFKSLMPYYKYSLPLMPFLIMSWLNSFVGRFILIHLVDLKQAGVYSFNSSLITRLFFLNVVVGYTVLPYISKFWNEGNKKLVKKYLLISYKIGIFFSIPLSCGLILTAPTIIHLLSGGNYQVDYTLIFILCLSSVFQLLYNIYSYLIDLSRKTILYNLIFLVTSILNIILNFLLIPFLNLYGVAIALLITYLVQLILTIIIGSKVSNLVLNFDIKFTIKCIISAIIMSISLYIIYKPYTMFNLLYSTIIAILLYLICMCIFDIEVRSLMKKIRKFK